MVTAMCTCDNDLDPTKSYEFQDFMLLQGSKRTCELHQSSVHALVPSVDKMLAGNKDWFLELLSTERTNSGSDDLNFDDILQSSLFQRRDSGVSMASSYDSDKSSADTASVFTDLGSENSSSSSSKSCYNRKDCSTASCKTSSRQDISISSHHPHSDYSVYSDCFQPNNFYNYHTISTNNVTHDTGCQVSDIKACNLTLSNVTADCSQGYSILYPYYNLANACMSSIEESNVSMEVSQQNYQNFPALNENSNYYLNHLNFTSLCSSPTTNCSNQSFVNHNTLPFSFSAISLPNNAHPSSIQTVYHNIMSSDSNIVTASLINSCSPISSGSSTNLSSLSAAVPTSQHRPSETNVNCQNIFRQISSASPYTDGQHSNSSNEIIPSISSHSAIKSKNLKRMNSNADIDAQSISSETNRQASPDRSEHSLDNEKPENSVMTKTNLKSFIIKRRQEQGKEDIDLADLVSVELPQVGPTIITYFRHIADIV